MIKNTISPKVAPKYIHRMYLRPSSLSDLINFNDGYVIEISITSMGIMYINENQLNKNGMDESTITVWKI